MKSASRRRRSGWGGGRKARTMMTKRPAKRSSWLRTWKTSGNRSYCDLKPPRG